MDATRTSDRGHARNVTTTERASDTELVVTRTFDGPAHLVFEAWTRPELIVRWWAPESFGIKLVSCEADVRTGGTYRFQFAVPNSDQLFDFFGRYIDVEPPKRIVWTNEEEHGSVTTVTFTERDGKTHLVLRDVYPSKEVLDEALASGSTGGWPEQFDQLDVFLAQP